MILLYCGTTKFEHNRIDGLNCVKIGLYLFIEIRIRTQINYGTHKEILFVYTLSFLDSTKNNEFNMHFLCNQKHDLYRQGHE